MLSGPRCATGPFWRLGLDHSVAEDYDTAGDGYFADATEAAQLGAERVAETFLRRARACWHVAQALRAARPANTERT